LGRPKHTLNNGISTNPILNAFQITVKKYDIPQEFITSFMQSMEADLTKGDYQSVDEYRQYIYGSADVVGLMCLRVFVGGDAERFELLKHSAMRLGSAFQKVNFLRDLKMDYEQLNRSYFPNTDLAKLDERSKKDIEEIEADLREGFVGYIATSVGGHWVCTSLTYTIANYYISWQKHRLRIFSTPVFGYRITRNWDCSPNVM
jgi:phytoene/squalene synthetase